MDSMSIAVASGMRSRTEALDLLANTSLTRIPPASRPIVSFTTSILHPQLKLMMTRAALPPFRLSSGIGQTSRQEL